MNRIKELRIQNNETQSELGKLLNLSKATISKYEKGDLDISSEVLRNIAVHYGVSIDYLLGYTDESISNLDKRLQDNNIKASASSDIDLVKYAQLDEDKKKFVDKQMNTMIDMFLEEKRKKKD